METILEWRERSSTGSWLAGSFLLHAGLAGVVLAISIFHPSDRWGENASTAGAIQASMVSSLPLPPRPSFDNQSVLATDQPSPAPIQNKVATVEQPKPDAIPIPVKNAKPAKVADKPAPAVPHPQPTPPQVNKVATGESAGIQIPEVVQQIAHGTATAAIQDRNFGNRFAYYGKIIEQKVAQNWYSSQVDPRTANGKRVTIVFDVNRDGAPVNPRVLTSSGAPSLDQSALQAVQRTDGFGPLPSGDHLTVQYSFDYHQ